VFTVYNLHREKQGQVETVDVNSPDPDTRRRTYNGFEIGFNGRYGPASFFGGWTFDRLIDVNCDSQHDPNSFRFCDQSQYDVPLNHEFKLSGSYRLPYDVQVNAAVQSYPGPFRPTTWSIARTTRYAPNCIGPCTPGALVIPSLTPATLSVALAAPGSDYYGRQTQLDLGFRKLFRIGRFQYSGQVDIFNATNSSYVKSETRTYGPALGRPLSTLQPRTLRLAAQMRF
jgi:hypothetical protein